MKTRARTIEKVLLPLFIILLLSCKPTLPSGIINEEKMADLLVDFHLAQGMAEARGNDIDVLRYKYIQAVFQKHHITEAQFDSSMVYWSGRAEEFSHIYDNVVTRIQAQAERMGLEAAESKNRFAFLTNVGDTANIWVGKDYGCVVANPVGCIYSFKMEADSTFRPGDRFVWIFKSQFVAHSMNNEAIALLNFYYDKDTVACVSELVRNNLQNVLSHNPDKDLDSLNLRSIAGYIYLPLVNDTDKPQPLLISEIKFIRMHKQKPVETPEEEDDTALSDSIDTDTVWQKSERLTPLQVRESQPKERKIRVTKENPNPIHPDRGIPQRINRRKK